VSGDEVTNAEIIQSNLRHGFAERANNSFAMRHDFGRRDWIHDHITHTAMAAPTNAPNSRSGMTMKNNTIRLSVFSSSHSFSVSNSSVGCTEAPLKRQRTDSSFDRLNGLRRDGQSRIRC